MSGQVAIADILAWYLDAGVDEPLADAPIDRFAQSETMAAERSEAKARPAPPPVELESAKAAATSKAPPTLSGEAAAKEAARVAAAASDLAELKAAIEAFEGCGLKGTARTTLFASGDPSAKLTVVGDVPDRDEDAEGTPFASASGAMLERMLVAIGIRSDETYRLVASPWRTPGQRQLTPQEKATVAPFLLRHLELAQPPLVLLMGGTAAELAIGPGKRLPALRGRWLEPTFGAHAAQAICTFHPNFLMNQPEQKRLAWADLLRLKEKL